MTRDIQQIAIKPAIISGCVESTNSIPAAVVAGSDVADPNTAPLPYSVIFLYLLS